MPNNISAATLILTILTFSLSFASSQDTEQPLPYQAELQLTNVPSCAFGPATCQNLITFKALSPKDAVQAHGHYCHAVVGRPSPCTCPGFEYLTWTQVAPVDVKIRPAQVADIRLVDFKQDAV